MNHRYVRAALRLSLSCNLLLMLTVISIAQQVPDPNFDPTVARPAYTKNHPRVLFDEAHNNFHTAGGRYKAFADLVTSDGYRVTPNTQKFTKETLAGYVILVISNALGAPVEQGFAAANKPAFTEAECDAVRDWVNAGGALFAYRRPLSGRGSGGHSRKMLWRRDEQRLH